MKKRGLCTALAAVVGGYFIAAAGTTVSFELLGDLPGGIHCSEALDVSADGSVVVGKSGSFDYYSAFRYEGGVLTPLVDNGLDQIVLSTANCVSADGQVIAGTGSFGVGYSTILTTYRHSDDKAVRILSYHYMAPVRYFVEGMSADGNCLVVCSKGTNYATRTFVCQNGDPIELEIGADVINGMSADGTVIVGRGSGPNSAREGLIYKDGSTIWLGNLLEDHVNGYSEAFAASADGSIVVGSTSCTEGCTAFVWQDGVMTGLDFPSSAELCSSRATDVSAEGSVIVGFFEYEEDYHKAVMWCAADGFVPVVLDDLLDQYGIDRAGYSLVKATAVSADGTTIVGNAFRADGCVEAFRVQILDPVEFADANLEVVVRDALAKPEGIITPEDMESLTTLIAYDCGISSLEGIQYAANLKVLDLGNNQIKDLSPLSGLTGLKQLYLEDNLISDVIPLKDMLNLCDSMGNPGLDVRGNYLHLYTGSPAFIVLMNLKYGGSYAPTVESVPQCDFTTWGGYPVRPDGSVDTTNHMGELYTQYAPWVFCTRLQTWAYVEEACAQACEGWIYTCDVDCMDLLMLEQTSWGWSFCLNRWVYAPEESLINDIGWVYLEK